MIRFNVNISYCLLLLFLLQLLPDSSWAQYRTEVLIESAKKDIQQSNFTSAINKLNICISTEPSNVEAYYFRAACKYSLYDNIGAEQDFTSSLTMYSAYFYDAYYFRSQVRYRMGNYKGAFEDINKVIEKQNKNPKLLVERAFIKLATNDFLGAIADCEKALQLNYINEDVYLCKAAAEDALADYENALCDFDRALEMNPKNVNAYVRRGITRFNRTEYFEAINNYNQAINLDSTYTFAYYSRAEARLKLNDNTGALSDFNVVIYYEPQNAFAYFNRGVMYSNMHKTKNAIEDFDKVLQINPNNIQALFNRAKLKENKKDYKGAIADYSKIIELYPYFMEAYYNRAQVKLKLNDTAGAKKDMETGKLMSEVLHSKSNSQLSRDSALMENLMRLSADFSQTPKSDIDSLDIQFQPFFYITESGKNEKNCYKTSPLLNKINKSESRIFYFTNCEVNPADSVLYPEHIAGRYWVDLVRETNNAYINDASELVNKLIQRDSSNALAYFQRALITCRGIELYEKYNVSLTTGDFADNSEKNKTKEKWISALNDFSKALELQPTFEMASFNRANVKCKLLDFEGALKDYETSVRINPYFAEAHFNSGFVMYYLNQKNSACEEFSKAGELGITSAYSFIKKYCTSVTK